MLEAIKQYGSLALQLAIAIVLAVAAPVGFLAALLVQVLHLAYIGAGGEKLSKVVVSAVVFLVAVGLAYAKLDGAFPAFPDVGGGDVAAGVQAIFGWFQAVLAFASPIIGAAMIQYNLILEKVLAFLGDSVGLAFEPE